MFTGRVKCCANHPFKCRDSAGADAAQLKIDKNSAVMQEMDGRLKSVADAVNRITEEDARRDKALADQEKRIATLENDLKLKSQEIEYLQEKLNGLQGEIQTKANKVLVWVLGSVGVAGFALTILQFFI